MPHTLANLIQVTLNGLATGSLYALLLFGILIVYRVSKAVNFAHGQLAMIAAFFCYYLYSRGVMPVGLAIGVGLAVATLLSYLTDRALLERLPAKSTDGGLDLVITLGLMILFGAVAESWFGNNTYSFLSIGNNDQVLASSVFLNLNQLLTLIGTAMFLGLFAWFLLKTPAGVSMRASAADPDLALSVGLNTTRIRSLTWAFAGLVAGVTGLLTASRLSVDAFYMTPFLIKAFVAGIIGGLDRFVTPLLIAFGLAIYESWAVYLVGSNDGTPAVFLLVIVVLLVLPRRFLDERREARA